MKYQIYVISVITIIYFSFNIAYGADITRPVPEPKVVAKIMAKDFLKFSATQYAHITGKKMNLWDKLSFQLMKMKMKQEIKKNPELTLNDYMTQEKKKMGRGWWILIGFVGGLFLLAIIFVIIYGKAN